MDTFSFFWIGAVTSSPLTSECYGGSHVDAQHLSEHLMKISSPALCVLSIYQLFTALVLG